MIQIDDKIVSFDLFDEYFCCDYEKCQGICCSEGDEGAPLDMEEIMPLEQRYEAVRHQLPIPSLKAIKKHGVCYVDPSGDHAVTLVNHKDCAFALRDESGNLLCALEKHRDDNSNADFIKPMSCRLYPIRLGHFSTFTALNYDRWDICKDARRLGRDKGIKVYQFLEQPLIDCFGQDFYDQLVEADRLLMEQRNQ